MNSRRRFFNSILLLALSLLFVLPLPVLAEDSTLLDSVRNLIRNRYVDPVSEEILNLPTIEEIIDQLGDPYTVFMSPSDASSFTGSIEGTFSGIGIYLDIVSQGVLVTGIIEGSPAEEKGLKAGDIIIQAGGTSLAGLSAAEATALIKGPEGTAVDLIVLRDTATFSLTVTRRTITVPSSTAEMKDGGIGYIDINTFASNTGTLFGDELEQLRAQNPSAYVIDLRNNGGGYVSVAQDIAGYLVPYKDSDNNSINDNLVIQTESRVGLLTYPAVKHDLIIDKPSIFITNNSTASASEILAGAARDYSNSFFVGSRTYGKGCMQEMWGFTEGESSLGSLKLTVARFTTPLGQVIHKVGLPPDLLIEETDPLLAARLLLSASVNDADKTGLVKLEIGNHTFAVDCSQASEAEYWPVYAEILDRLGEGRIMRGQAGGWEAVNSQEIADRWQLYYPAYRLINSLMDIEPAHKFTVRFSRAVSRQTVNEETIELVDSATGERIPLKFEFLNDTDLQVTPTLQTSLQTAGTYWLLVHPAVCDQNNKTLQSGAICTATVK